MSQRTKKIAIVVVVIVIAFIGYKMFFAGSGSGDTTLVADQSKTEFVDGQTILALLDRLNKVTLDSSVFSNQTFTSLINFEKPIQDQVIGRQNPFQPIGADGSGIILPKGTSTSRVR